MRPFVVSGCLTAVTDMAAVSLFWRSSGVLLGSSGVLLAFFWVLLAFFCFIERQKNARRTPEERQKNARRTQKNPEEPRRRRTPAPPDQSLSTRRGGAFLFLVFSPAFLILFLYFSYTFPILFFCF